jgi:nucleoside-diphosphate-sugar epimerase
MASKTNLRLLLTGATGYIGGSILHQLLRTKFDNVKNLQISVIVRSKEHLDMFKKQGLNAILFESLDNAEQVQKAAREHDVVIHTASGYHTSSAEALIRGLGERRKETGKDVYYIHTTGTSNLADRPISKLYVEQREFSDKDDLYEYELHRESIETYPQRTTDITVIKTGLEVSVKTYLIMSPLIYGLGTGPVNKLSIQSPTIIRDMIKHENAAVIGEGKAIWNNVHIEDVARLYELVLHKVISGESIPEGKRGFYFSATDEHSWWEFAEIISRAGYREGVSRQEEPKELSLQEGAKRLTGGDIQFAELGFASNARCKAVLSRELGWKPIKTKEDFKRYLPEEVKYIAKHP